MSITDNTPEIWVFGDLRSPRLMQMSLKVLGKARELADSISGKTAMVLMGSTENNDADSSEQVLRGAAALECTDCGADFAYLMDNPILAKTNAEVYSEALVSFISDRSPALMLFALTDLGRELAARTARLLGSGLIADCVDMRYEDGKLIAGCPAWGGEIMAEIGFIEGHGTGIATVSTHELKISETKGRPGSMVGVHFDHLHGPRGLRLISCTTEDTEKMRLEDAEVVVVGGAGLGSAEGFGRVRELAAALGGEVAATRPPVLGHWVDEERLIGQTGKSVRPGLLFSVGTSGAVQYTAGIMDSGTIVAINRDPGAPIFEVADIGIVADAQSLLPILTDKVKAQVMRKLTDLLMHEKCESEIQAGFGDKVAKLRQTHEWSIEDLAQATGQSPEFIQELEADKVNPSVSFLLRLARALDVDPGTFLSEQEKTAIRDERTKAFVKRTENYSYQTLTPGKQDEHLRGFMITIEPRQDHKPVAYKHEGEEFVYVLDGELDLILGNKNHHLSPGQCMHFNSDVPHKLKSRSDIPTRCLVMLYTP